MSVLRIAVIMWCAAAAQAQPYLEFTVNTSGVVDGGLSLQTHARLIVDAGDPDQQVFASSGVFGSAVVSPRMVSVQTFEMDLSMTSDLLTISFDGWYEGNFVILQLVASHAIPMDADGSLQDNPNIYNNAWTSMSCDVQYNFVSVSSDWNELIGFVPSDAHFNLHVREVPDFIPEPACPGDINGDGDLNFLDVSKFLKDYSMGCE
jgi:hypothetical protein